MRSAIRMTRICGFRTDPNTPSDALIYFTMYDDTLFLLDPPMSHLALLAEGKL